MKKRLLLWIIALVAFSGSTLFAQDLTGTWQGTLSPGGGRDLRTVIKISKQGDNYQAVFYSIDQGGQGMNGTATIQGSGVKMAVPGIGGTYEGKLEADGVTITGTFSQGRPFPLNLKKATTPETTWAIPEPPPPPKPMRADANPSFEVATIKPSRPDQPGKAFTMRGKQFATINTTLEDLIVFAYGIHTKQLINAPDWASSQKFDINATPDEEGTPNSNQLRTMMQKLIADRFQLKFHRDKRELSVYAITTDGKNPNKLTKSSTDGGLPGLFFRGLGNLPARNATMADLAGLMQSAVLDRPVVDQTGITGRYDFTLIWTPDDFQFASFGPRPPTPPGAAPSNNPDLFTAFREQLGLRLESTKAQTEVFVLDKVEKPSEN
jgi:uncharacterized protein (TIGR03435 family)